MPRPSPISTATGRRPGICGTARSGGKHGDFDGGTPHGTEHTDPPSYREVTDRIIDELEQGRVPWVQPPGGRPEPATPIPGSIFCSCGARRLRVGAAPRPGSLRRWVLDYRRFHGDPGNPGLWEELAAFMETPRPHATGPMLRPVVVGIDSGGHYTQQVAEFVRARGSGYQALKGSPPQRFGAVLARRSVTTDNLETYGREGLLLVCGNSGKASCFSLMRQSIAGAEPRPMVWPMDETRYGLEEFEGIVSESLIRTIDMRTGATRLMWRKIVARNEPLDVLVYSLALVSHLGLGFVLHEADAIARAAERKEAA